MNKNARIIQNPMSGFSLLELLVVIAILGILMTTGLPQLSDFLKNTRLTAQTNTFVSVLNYSRTQAISTGDNVFLTAINANDSSNDWGAGWTLWIDGLDTPACVGNDGNSNVPNRNLEDDITGCSEVLKIFEFPESSITIDMKDSFSNLSAADVTGDLTSTTLMFRGASGTPALRGDATNYLEFYICDDRSGELGRHLRVNRNTGRVALLDKEYTGCS